MRLECDQIGVVCATPLEAAAARRELRGVRVYEAGIALAKLRGGPSFAGVTGGPSFAGVTVVISCGLAGGLRDQLPSGTVLIPTEVRRPDGTVLYCDAEVAEMLAHAARALGHEPVRDPLLTADTVVRGSERAVWASAGYAGVDMETGLLEAPRIAAVRVILDTPRRELSADWLHPARALLNPNNWPEALWLARAAPRSARRAAAIVAAACS